MLHKDSSSWEEHTNGQSQTGGTVTWVDPAVSTSAVTYPLFAPTTVDTFAVPATSIGTTATAPLQRRKERSLHAARQRKPASLSARGRPRLGARAPLRRSRRIRRTRRSARWSARTTTTCFACEVIGEL